MKSEIKPKKNKVDKHIFMLKSKGKYFESN